MTREEHLAEAAAALRPVGESFAKGRAGLVENVNPAAMMLILEYAKVRALCALAASGAAPPGEVLELAGDTRTVQQAHTWGDSGQLLTVGNPP